MTRLGFAFKNSQDLRIKTFELAGQLFRVRIPLTKEMEAMEERIKQIEPDAFKNRYDKMVSGFDNVNVEGIVKTEDDVVVDGRSTKELVKSVIQMENRVVEFIKLLVPTEGYTLENLTYEEIEDEWPLSVQLEIVSRIGDTIAPSYKEERKN